MSHLVKAEPALLAYRGEFLTAVMRRERVTESEVLAGIRSQGLASLDDVQAVVLETDGSFSVVGRAEQPAPLALAVLTARDRPAH